MKRNDLYLTGAMLFIALVWFFITKYISAPGSSVSIYRNNELIQSISISDDGIYPVYGDSNEILLNVNINNNSVFVTDAVCPDRLCEHQKKISGSSESIVCLPNSILIQLSDNTKSEYNAVTY